MGEYFVAIVLAYSFVHNWLLYSGGCLSRQWFNVVGHIVSLSQLSFTIVEGRPWKFYRRGRLYEVGHPEYDPTDKRSKLQMAHDVITALLCS